MKLLTILNKIIDEMNKNARYGAEPIPHGRTPVECLNIIIGGDTKFRSVDDAVEFLAREYVKNK